MIQDAEVVDRMKWQDIKKLNKEELADEFKSLGQSIGELSFWINRIENDTQFKAFEEQFADDLKRLHDLRLAAENVHYKNM